MRITCRRPQSAPRINDGAVRRWYTSADQSNYTLITTVQVYQWVPYRATLGSQWYVRRSGSQHGRWVYRGKAGLRDNETFRDWYVRQLRDGWLFASVLDPVQTVDKYDQLYAFTVERCE